MVQFQGMRRSEPLIERCRDYRRATTWILSTCSPSIWKANIDHNSWADQAGVCVCALPHWTNPPKIGSIFIVFVCDRYSYFRLSLEEVFASLLWVRCGDICTWYVETLNERGTRWPFAPSVRMETKTKVCALFTIRRQNKQAAHA